MNTSCKYYLRTQAFRLRASRLVAWALLATVCVPSATVAQLAAAVPVPIPQAPHSEFAISAGMLDTWNAIGQVLVRMDGVTYEGRAQMLGLYAVQYRGERFLIVTRGQVLRSAADSELTRVCAVLQDGKPNRGDPAAELLARLEERLPDELKLIAAGGRQPAAARAESVASHR